MKYLPYHAFELSAPMSLDAARAALQTHVEPKKMFRLTGAGADRFQGEVSAAGFEISRIIGYRNSFLPVVKGEFHKQGAFLRVAIRMQLHPVVIAFCAIWLAVVASIGLGAIISLADWRILLFVFAGGLFLYAMVMGGFWFEASKQERVLREIFQAM